MTELQDIRSLNDFHRHSKLYTKQLAKTGKPTALIVDGEVKLVVQDAAAYRKLVRRAGLMQSLAILNKRLGESRRGDVIPLAHWNNTMRKKHRLEDVA